MLSCVQRAVCNITAFSTSKWPFYTSRICEEQPWLSLYVRVAAAMPKALVGGGAAALELRWPSQGRHACQALHRACASCAQAASPEASEDTVNCSRKTAGAVSVDMLCEESVCSADDAADVRPDKKKQRRTEAPSVRS